MTNAFLEYLTSNENIAYPFRENVLGLDYERLIDDVTHERSFSLEKLPTDYFADGQFLLYNNTTAKLVNISVVNVGISMVRYTFLLGSSTVTVSVVPPYATIALHSKISLQLPNLGHFILVTGEAFNLYNVFINSKPSKSTNFESPLEFEPTVVDVRLNRVETLQIYDKDFIDTLSTTGFLPCYDKIPLESTSCSAMLGYPSFLNEYYTDIKKDLPIVLVPGYNIAYSQDGNNITIDCSPGIGAGQYPCEAQIDDMMSEEIITPAEDRVIYTINKLESKKGKFLIRWDDCYRIVPDPTVVETTEGPQIQYTSLHVYGDCKPCCDCADYIAVGEVLQSLVNNYIGPISTKVRAMMFNNPERLTSGSLDPEIYDDPKTWDSYKFDEGVAKAVSTTLVDTDKNWKENNLIGKVLVKLPRGSNILVMSKITANTSTTITTETPLSWTLADSYKIMAAEGCGSSTSSITTTVLYDSTKNWEINKLKGKIVLKTGPTTGSSYIESNSSTGIFTHTPISWNYGDTYEIRDRTWGYSPLVRMWNIEVLPNLRSVNFDIKLVSGTASTVLSEKAVQSSTTARLYTTVKNFVIANPESDADLYPVWTWVDFKDICNLRPYLYYWNNLAKQLVKDEYLEENTAFLQDGTDNAFGFNTLNRNAGATRTSLMHRIYPSSQFLDRLKGHFADELLFTSPISIYTGAHDGEDDSPILMDTSKDWIPQSLVGCQIRRSDGATATIIRNSKNTIRTSNVLLTWSSFPAPDTYTIYSNGAQSIQDVINYIDWGSTDKRVTEDRLLITRLLGELKGIRIKVIFNNLKPGLTFGTPTSYIMFGPYRFTVKDISSTVKHWYVDKYDSYLNTYMEQKYYTTIGSVLFSDDTTATKMLIKALDFIGYPSVYFSSNSIFIRPLTRLYVVTDESQSVNFVETSLPLINVYNQAALLFKKLNGELNREWRTKIGFFALNNKAALGSTLLGKAMLGINCEVSDPSTWASNLDDLFSETYKGTATYAGWNNGPTFTKEDRNDNRLTLKLERFADDLTPSNAKVRWVISDDINNILYYHDLGVDSFEEAKYAPWDTRWLISGSDDNLNEKSFTTLAGRWRNATTHKVVPQMIICPLNRDFSRPKWIPSQLKYDPELDYISFIKEINSDIGNIVI